VFVTWVWTWQNDHICCCFQLEDDPDLAPEIGNAGYQFDPNTNVPKEGFNFWLADDDIAQQVEIGTDTVENCDKADFNKSDDVTSNKGVNSDSLSANGSLIGGNGENLSTASIYGSDSNLYLLNSGSNSEADSAGMDGNYVTDENDNIEIEPPASSQPYFDRSERPYWGGIGEEPVIDHPDQGIVSYSSSGVGRIEIVQQGRHDHDYMAGLDTDLLSWYSLNTS